MCYNCGCGLITDEMGKGALSQGGGSLVETDIKHMAEKWGMSVEDTKKNIYGTLKQQFEKK